jgi:hypothetical protein
MLLPESAAKMRFCPLGRGIAPLGEHTGKFASGINMAPTRYLTHCQGTACMLWETHQIAVRQMQHHCVHPDDQPEEDVKKCLTCKGTRKFVTEKEEPIGFCGAGHNGVEVAALNALTGEVAKLVKLAMKAGGVSEADMNPPTTPKEPTP